MQLYTLLRNGIDSSIKVDRSMPNLTVNKYKTLYLLLNKVVF